MQFHILTLFPEMVENGLQTSILGRAIQKGLIGIHAVNIRDYTQDKHNKVDDYPYGTAGLRRLESGCKACRGQKTSAGAVYEPTGQNLFPGDGKGACTGRRADFSVWAL